MNVWAEKQLDELGYVSRGRSRHRPRDEKSLYGGIFPFIQTADVKHAEFYITSHTQTYSEKGLAQSRLWQAGTLCITIAANIADTAILAYDACFPDSIIGFIADPDICDVRFVKYFFSTVQSRYKQIAQGAAQDNLSQQKLLTLKIPTPSLATQQRIAEILSNYDRLIDNNTRRIALLEESIHRLYQEWFVYLRFPECDRVKVVDGVPEGWEKKTLSRLATLNYGKALKKDDRKTGTIPVYGSSGIVGYHNQALVSAPGIIVGRKGNVGSVFWASMPFYPIDTVYYIDGNESSFFLYHTLSKLTFVNTDAAVPGLNRNYAYSIELLLPSPSLIQDFESFVTPIHNQIECLRSHNQKLREARDLLLPRLMNGSLAV